ncbi:MAG UNVERIFIED_CONTAM: hypothetical protein LVT10_14060 [Anaerolineae bacterium]|jgi:hypothetical protein
MLIPNLILLGGLALAAYRVRFRRHQKLAVMLTQPNHASVVEENKYLRLNQPRYGLPGNLTVSSISMATSLLPALLVNPSTLWGVVGLTVYGSVVMFEDAIDSMMDNQPHYGAIIGTSLVLLTLPLNLFLTASTIQWLYMMNKWANVFTYEQVEAFMKNPEGYAPFGIKRKRANDDDELPQVIHLDSSHLWEVPPAQG